MQKPANPLLGSNRPESQRGHVTPTGGRQQAPVAFTPSPTGGRQSTMKRKRSGNWDLMYGFGFLVLFILVHTMFITHETRSFKMENSNVSASDFLIQRARKFKQSRKELVEAVEKMREPPPASRKDAAALAVNMVYRKNLRKRNLIFLWKGDGSDEKSRYAYFRDACSKANQTGNELTDCVLDNEMSARRSNVQKMCDKIKEHPGSGQKLLPFVDSRRIYVLKYRKLVWCPVYKAASTNWISILPTLSNFRSSQIKILKRRFIQPNELAPIVAKPMGLTQFRKYVSANDPVKFLIVRHPFDRLLSAYRDKLERMNEFFYAKYGESIVEKYRHQGIKKFGAKFYAEKIGNCSSYECEDGEKSMPTFWEFVRALLDGEVAVDDHWSPIHTACSLCRLSYDLVLHFEYLNEEQPYLLRQLGLENFGSPDKWLLHVNPYPLTTQQRMDYFAMLDESEIEDLYNFYKLDFDLFEYDLKSYLKNQQ